MTWRDTYRPAAFRGVAFFVESTTTSHGRRQAVHEAAQRDVPYTEDLGRKAREFSVDGYLLGADYHLTRDALIEACEQGGPGQLVHPYRGELMVVCRGLSVSESSKDGGMCQVSLTFLESGEASFPRSEINSVNAIGAAGNSLIGSAKLGFVKDFLTTGFPAFVLDAAAEHLTQITDFLSAPGFNFAGELAAASDYAYAVRDLAADAMDLVATPSKLAGRLAGVMGLMRGSFGGNSFAALAGLFNQFGGSGSGGGFGVGSGSSGGSVGGVVALGSNPTPSRQQQATNGLALNELVRQVAVAESAKAAVITEYPSYQEALTRRDSLLAAIDAESERTPNDQAYVALSSLRAEIVRGIPRPEVRLPQLRSYTPRATQPALLVAYQLYGDAARGDEISARNAPAHPGFLTGGTALQVLADG